MADECDRNDSELYRMRLLTCLLWVGGVVALLDGLETSAPPRALVRFFAAGASLLLLVYLRRTSNIRVTTLCYSLSSGIVFVGDFVTYGDPIYLTIGFSIPLSSALLLRSRDACLVLATYCLTSLSFAWMMQVGILSPEFEAPTILARTVAAIAVISCMAGPVIWMQRLYATAEREKMRQQVRFQTICDYGEIAFLESDASGKITFARGKLLEDMGYCSQSLLGRDQIEFIHESDYQNIYDRAVRQDGGFSFHGEARIKSADARNRWVHMSGSQVRDAKGRQKNCYTLKDIHDSVEHRNHYYELSRLESLGNVCGGLAHDFNNLLTVIGVHASNVDDELTRNELLLAQQRAADLTAGLLTFARKQTYRAVDTDLVEFISSSKNLVEQLIPANVRCEWIIEPKTAFIHIDPAQLQQVLVNLVTNGIQAMPDGGKLTIGLRTLVLNGDFALRQQFPSETGAVEITVTDTGHGMDSETVSRAVEPFYTTKPRGMGTGLGLATAHGTANRANGSLTISSRVNRGTEISMSFPLLTRTCSKVEKDSSELSVEPGAKRVILVEDNIQVAKSIGRMLETWGHDLTVYYNAEDAWANIPNGAEFDLIVSDVMLPGMNGVELAEKVLGIRPGARLILTTGYQVADLESLSKYADSIRFLAKPFQPGQLRSTVLELFVSSDVS